MKLGHEVIFLIKFHEDRTEIIDFLLIVNFSAAARFARTVSIFQNHPLKAEKIAEERSRIFLIIVN